MTKDYFSFLTSYYDKVDGSQREKINKYLSSNSNIGFKNLAEISQSKYTIEDILQELYERIKPQDKAFPDYIADDFFNREMVELVNLFVSGPLGKLTYDYLRDNNGKFRVPPLAKALVDTLKWNDVLVSLNYDLFLDCAIEYTFKKANYDSSDNTMPKLFKPHGSINFGKGSEAKSSPVKYLELFIGNGFDFTTFKFFDQNHREIQKTGILPPIKNKESLDNFKEVEKMYKDLEKHIYDEVIFWGIGLTGSDEILFEIMKKMIGDQAVIKIINPAPKDELFERYDEKLNVGDHKVKYYSSMNEYLAGN